MGEKYCDVCPTCGGVALSTFAFNGWEVFCLKCKTGAGMFDGWPMKNVEERDYEATKLKFNQLLRLGEYDTHPRLNAMYLSSTFKTEPAEAKEE